MRDLLTSVVLECLLPRLLIHSQNECEQGMTHQPAMSFSNSFHFPFNRAGGSTSNVRLMYSAPSTLIVMLFLASCQTQHHYDYAKLIPPIRSFPPSAYGHSIHHSDFTIDPLVTNGDCYEEFQIAIPESITTISLPTCTTTQRLDGEYLVGHLKKALGWAGHPDDTKTSIDDERSKMGVAMKIKGRELLITSFGTWSSFEGGSSVSLLVGIPTGTSIHYAKDQPANRTAERLTQEGWFVIPSRPALKKDYDRFTTQ
jgi:hypothetical protein